MFYNIQADMIDSHFHTEEMTRKGLEPSAVLSELAKQGMRELLDAGVILEDFEKRLSRREHYPELFFAAGIHPNIPKEQWPQGYEETLRAQAGHPAVKAIGETGLDFYRSNSTEDDQHRLLNLHYSLSLEVRKPLIFHCRSAEKELRAWISERDFPHGAVLHCFSGDPLLGKSALEKGFMISLAGNATFKNAQPLRDCLEWIPIEKLLVETDAPYLSPHPLRGKANHPGHIGYIYEMISHEKGCPMEQLIPRIRQNFRTFLGLA